MRRWILMIVVCLLTASPVWAWHQQGHEAVSRGAAKMLPDVVPAFLREGGDAIAHYSVDPDLTRMKPLAALSAAKGIDHFFDVELIRDLALPEQRYEFLALLEKQKLRPRDVGMGLYALIEARQQLAASLAEYRKWPENPHIRAKCLMHAGLLSHFAADLSQPLHTTIHHDGRVDPAAGRSPRTGIHHKVDDLLRHLTGPALEPAMDTPVLLIAPGVAAAYEQILKSHALVDRVYELEPLLPAPQGDAPLQPEVAKFARDRYQAAVALTAAMIFSAWEDSASVEVPTWLTRE
jgi:hypothetical protein